MAKSSSRRPPASKAPTPLPNLFEEVDDDPFDGSTLRRAAPGATETEGSDSPPATSRRHPLPNLIEAYERGEGDGTQTDETAVTLTPRSERGKGLLTLMTGVDAGRIFVLEAGVTIVGRGPSCHIRLNDRGLSREHCKIRGAKGRRFRVEDLESTNGTYVDGKQIHSAKLDGGQRIQLGADVILRFSFGDDSEEQLARKLYESSTRDALTKCYVRGVFDERLASEIAFARRHGSEVGVILFDVDKFKSINDRYGHPAGDGVLKAIAQCVQALVRGEDLFARYGGEEFAVLVRGGKHADMVALAERIRSTIEAFSIPIGDRLLSVSISAGVATLSQCHAAGNADAITHLADTRLYAAKQQGRNRVVSK